MKWVLCLVGMLFLNPTAWSQSDSKIDTVIALQKQMMQKQTELYNEVALEPLTGKNYGIELNPARLLVASADKTFSLAGGFSLFNVSRKAEIAFPVLIQSGHGDRYYEVEAHYRRFLGEHQKGFYLSGGATFAHISSKEDEFLSDVSKSVTRNKLGVFCGIGYRYFSKSGLYWGTGLSVGRYFTGTDKKVDTFFSSDFEKIYLDFQLLKFGIAF
ncbi:hypothetical protein K1X84_08655 [bacterium]|nr:hypothetical protein [bacterium]